MIRMRPAWLIAVVMGISGIPMTLAYAKPCNSLAFIGTLEWSKLYPTKQFAQDKKNPGGSHEVYVSNSCGRAESKFRVLSLIVGPKSQSVIIDSVLGEWCKPPVSVDINPNLITAVREAGKWVFRDAAPIKKDQAGREVILFVMPDVFLGVSTDHMRTPLKQPINIGPAEGTSKSWLKKMEQRGILKSEGGNLYVTSAIYLKDLEAALRQHAKSEFPQCLP